MTKGIGSTALNHTVSGHRSGLILRAYQTRHGLRSQSGRHFGAAGVFAERRLESRGCLTQMRWKWPLPASGRKSRLNP